MAELLLSGEDLLTPLRRRCRREFPLGAPEDLSGLSKVQRELAVLFIGDVDDDGEGAMTNYAYLYFNLLLLSAVQSPQSHMSENDGAGTLRKGRVAEAATARLLDLWLDPEVRASCGQAMDPGASFVCRALCTRYDCLCA